jgi:CTP:molybdopterin cytidylyltransferase MocA
VTAGVVLAAGAGRRFGGPKAPAIVDGERLVDRAVRLLQEAGCDPIYVVLGAWVGDVPGAHIVVNPNWDAGMSTSLRCALSTLNETASTDALITLVDLPGLTAEAMRRVLSAPGDIVQATFDGERGHPVRISRDHWESLSQTLEGDAGARAYLATRTDITLVEIGDIADGTDVDTPLPTQ